jgi:hypothetical protein
MKRGCILLALTVGLTSLAFAGKIYGSLAEAGKPVTQGVKIQVACGANTYDAETDTQGAFSLFVKDKGKCLLKVAYQGQTPSMEINSYDGSVQYDLILEKQDGRYALKRK